MCVVLNYSSRSSANRSNNANVSPANVSNTSRLTNRSANRSGNEDDAGMQVNLPDDSSEDRQQQQQRTDSSANVSNTSRLSNRSANRSNTSRRSNQSRGGYIDVDDDDNNDDANQMADNSSVSSQAPMPTNRHQRTESLNNATLSPRRMSSMSSSERSNTFRNYNRGGGG